MAIEDYPDLGPLPEVTPRDRNLVNARQELLTFVVEWMRRHQLSTVDYLYLLTDTVRSYLSILGSRGQ